MVDYYESIVGLKKYLLLVSDNSVLKQRFISKTVTSVMNVGSKFISSFKNPNTNTTMKNADIKSLAEDIFALQVQQIKDDIKS